MTTSPQFLLGLGTGRCGLRSLSSLLSQQTGMSCSLDDAPHLDWETDRPDRVLARLSRMHRARQSAIIADVASFYLPYAQFLLDRTDQVRMVCLRRDREETIASFDQWVDKVHPLPTDHWSRVLCPGFYRDIVRSRLYPKYDLNSRKACIAKYWDDYYLSADKLQAQYPDRFRIFDMDRALNSQEGQQELLDYCGIARQSQSIKLHIEERKCEAVRVCPGPARDADGMFDPRRCVVLVPFTGSIVPGCEASLRELERQGYAVRRVSGYAAIDQGRNQMATDALRDGYEETMWIDSDVVFDPMAVEKLRRLHLPISCGIYPQKGPRAVACHILPGTQKMTFGKKGGVNEILYAATGFLHVRRTVYETIHDRMHLPVCNERFGRPTIPFFAPMLLPEDEGHWYLAEDYAFSERARQCGFKIFADTSLRLWHVGNYSYGWEDAGVAYQRFDDFTLNFH